MRNRFGRYCGQRSTEYWDQLPDLSYLVTTDAVSTARNNPDVFEVLVDMKSEANSSRNKEAVSRAKKLLFLVPSAPSDLYAFGSLSEFNRFLKN